jgi:hypothetical protein
MSPRDRDRRRGGKSSLKTEIFGTGNQANQAQIGFVVRRDKPA